MKFLLSFLLPLLSAASSQGQDTMVLKGTLPESKGCHIVVEHRETSTKWNRIDTIALGQIGEFEANYEIPVTTEMRLRLLNNDELSQETIYFFGSADTISFSGCCQAYEVSGGVENQLISEYRSIASTEIDSLFLLGERLEQCKLAKNDSLAHEIEALQNHLEDIVWSKKDQFLLKHNTSLSTAFLLEEAVNMFYFTHNSRPELYSRFSTIFYALHKEVKNEPAGQAAKRRIEFWSKGQIGDRLSPLSLSTFEGESFSLRSLRGTDLIAITFWSSYYQPSEKTVSLLDSISNSYDNGSFTSVTVNVDPEEYTTDAYLFLTQNGIGGVKLRDMKQLDSPLAYDLGVETLPQTVFLDKHLRIVSRTQMKAEELTEFIANNVRK